MAEYIEREALIQRLKNSPLFTNFGEDGHFICNGVIDIIKMQALTKPTAGVVEVRCGHWFIVEYEYFTCSECGNSFYNGCESTAEAKQRLKDGLYDNYCGHCGAKMDGAE